ncbi:hypothetical protein VP01_2348g1 [Puccinia sorghi]|uniref:Uncharacterized protein n=1 Tax=Puccinia sorghi TaxID=27349 RepID=A0A0L6V7H1_9BASI|nr:hypothetical protein VP01_2348g1 [Puccinia sorghi]
MQIYYQDTLELGNNVELLEKQGFITWMASVPHGGTFATKTRDFVKFIDFISEPGEEQFKCIVTLIYKDPKDVVQVSFHIFSSILKTNALWRCNLFSRDICQHMCNPRAKSDLQVSYLNPHHPTIYQPKYFSLLLIGLFIWHRPKTVVSLISNLQNCCHLHLKLVTIWLHLIVICPHHPLVLQPSPKLRFLFSNFSNNGGGQPITPSHGLSKPHWELASFHLSSAPHAISSQLRSSQGTSDSSPSAHKMYPGGIFGLLGYMLHKILTSHSSPRGQRSSFSCLGKHPPFSFFIFSHSLSFFISWNIWLYLQRYPLSPISGELLALTTQPPTHTPNVTAPHVGNGTLGVPFYPSACQGIEINKYFFFEICTTAVEFNSLIDCNHKSRKKIPIKTQYQYDTAEEIIDNFKAVLASCKQCFLFA